VIGLPDGEDLFVIASNYGQDRHPSWYHNLKAHPRARVTVDGASREVEAVEVTDPAERERLYELASRAVIVFPAYKKRTDAIGRRIPIMRLK
jgi:deazaflavin-dependent oxidoreductase (nitroreductase family)